MSPKSYAYLPRVRLGQAEGSTATMRGAVPPRNPCPMNGKARPAKLLPPPVQASTTSGQASAICICSIASRPMMVWCSSTWFSTEPRAYLVSSRCAAISTASLMAIPKLPGWSGCSASTRRPYSVSALGEATQRAP